MSDKKIRKLSIGAEVKQQFHYIVGGVFEIPNKDTTISKRTISDIVETEKNYQLYIATGAISQHWKDIPKNNITTPEYFID